MVRRVLWPFLALSLIVAVPRPAAAQSHLAFWDATARRPSLAAPFSKLSFGPARFVPKPLDARIAFRSRWTAPDESPWRWVRTAHRYGGGVGFAPKVEAKGLPAGDCAMVRPADRTLDPKFAIAPPARVTHSGVIIPVAPCPVK